MIPWQHLVSSRAFFEELATDLSLGALAEPSAAAWYQGDLKREGFGHYAPGTWKTESLRLAVASLKEHGVPPVFVCVYAEMWQPAKSLAAHMTALTGEAYDVGADAWYFEVMPGAKGWSAHRGRSDAVLRQPDGFPDLLDTWVPLHDVSVHDACMHLLPLHADPHYPHAMSTPVEGLPPHLLPVRAGEALAWDANTLHAGGPCHPTMGRMRQSLGFTVGARARATSGRYHAARIESFEERVDLLAHQLLTYGPHGNAPADWTAWAKGHLTMLALSQHRGLGRTL